MTPLLGLDPSSPSKVTKKRISPQPQQREDEEDFITTIGTEETEMSYQTPCYTSDSLIGLLPERDQLRFRHLSSDSFYKRVIYIFLSYL